MICRVLGSIAVTALATGSAYAQSPAPAADIKMLDPTGPDPFTYNTLGPDAYHAQQYANPAYNVPPYPTTNPAQTNEPAQYSAPAAATSQPVPPYPEYPTNPGTRNAYGYGNSGTIVAPNTQGGNGVYVYQPGMSRR